MTREEAIENLKWLLECSYVDSFEDEENEALEMAIKELGKAIPIEKDIYPLTIIQDRYNGTYSGGRYLAFNLDFDDVPLEVIGDDVETANFFYKTKIKYGKGATIMDAVNDLIEKGVDE